MLLLSIIFQSVKEVSRLIAWKQQQTVLSVLVDEFSDWFVNEKQYGIVSFAKLQVFSSLRLRMKSATGDFYSGCMH